MATDIQIVFPVDVIPLTQIQFVPGVYPRTLDVIGADFRTVNEVLVNGVTSPSVVVLGPQRLLAQVPTNIINDQITSIQVTSNRLTMTEKSLLNFELGIRSQKVNGLLRLVQFFLKVLFTSQGQDIFSQNLGGNGLKNLGRNFSKQEGAGIVADFYVAVSNTSKQIIDLQSRNPRLPREEKLLSAQVVAANFNMNELALIVSVELLSQTGQPALANLML